MLLSFIFYQIKSRSVFLLIICKIINNHLIKKIKKEEVGCVVQNSNIRHDDGNTTNARRSRTTDTEPAITPPTAAAGEPSIITTTADTIATAATAATATITGTVAAVATVATDGAAAEATNNAGASRAVTTFEVAFEVVVLLAPVGGRTISHWTHFGCGWFRRGAFVFDPNNHHPHPKDTDAVTDAGTDADFRVCRFTWASTQLHVKRLLLRFSRQAPLGR